MKIDNMEQLPATEETVVKINGLINNGVDNIQDDDLILKIGAIKNATETTEPQNKNEQVSEQSTSEDDLTNGKDNLTNGHKDDLFNRENPLDVNIDDGELSDNSEESMNLHVTDDEDEGEEEKKDNENGAPNNTTFSSLTGESNDTLPPIDKQSTATDVDDMSSDADKMTTEETDDNETNKEDNVGYSATPSPDGLDLLEPQNDADKIEEEIDNMEDSNETIDEEKLDETDEKLKDEIGNLGSPGIDDNATNEFDNTEPENVLEEINKILDDNNDDANSETHQTSSEATESHSEDTNADGTTKKVRRRKKKKGIKKTLKKLLGNKNLKISKSLVENWKAANQTDKLESTDNIDIDEIPLLERTTSSDNLKELADVIEKDDESVKDNENSNDGKTSENEEENSTAEPTDVESAEKDKIEDNKELIDEEKSEDPDIAIISDTETAIKTEKMEFKDENSDSNTISSKKRSLDSSEESVEAKKLKINGVDDQKVKKKDFVALDSLRELLENKVNRLNRKSLEEFCIQKICEVIGQNSQLGELRHQIKVQEQLLETWKNKVVAISKQTRDLEIVKCRLIQDMRTKEKEGGNIAETTPVKITRSVGLQVCLQTAIAQRNRPAPQTPTPTPVTTPVDNTRRKPRPSLPARLPNNTPNMSPVQNKNIIPILPTKPNTPNKSIKTILPQRTPEVKDGQPSILNKALQKPTSSPASTVTTPTRKTPDAAPKAVIDLTDEDETSKAAPPASNNVRIVTTQIASSAPITTTSLVATSVSGPRLTYLVTPNGQQPQQVMLHTFSGAAPNRPTQVRANFMLKPITPNAVNNQRVNTIRLPGNPVQVLNQTITRPPNQIRIGGMPTMTRAVTPRQPQPLRHPAPLPGAPPLQPSQPSWKAMPPRPSLKISRVGDGIVLSWKILTKDLSHYEEIASYQLYAYQETNATPSTDMWRKVGDVKALALPMACTLTQFTDGNKYHFAVRAVDVKSRVGPFSPPEQITLT